MNVSIVLWLSLALSADANGKVMPTADRRLYAEDPFSPFAHRLGKMMWVYTAKKWKKLGDINTMTVSLNEGWRKVESDSRWEGEGTNSCVQRDF